MGGYSLDVSLVEVHLRVVVALDQAVPDGMRHRLVAVLEGEVEARAGQRELDVVDDRLLHARHLAQMKVPVHVARQVRVHQVPQLLVLRQLLPRSVIWPEQLVQLAVRPAERLPLHQRP